MASAQTLPTATAALNAASFADPKQPNGKLARGGIFSLFGSGLATQQLAASEFPISELLGGVEIEVTAGGDTQKALPLFVSPRQLNAILPSATPAGLGEMVVIVHGERSAPLAIEVTDHAPGVFTLRGTGEGPAVMTDPLEPDPNMRINSGVRAAHPGEPWDLWATGLGPIHSSDAERAPFQDRTDWNVKVRVAGREAQLIYRGRSGCCAGLDQVRFIVPAGIEGCCVAVEVEVNGVVSPPVSMSITGPGKKLCQTDLLANIPDELARFYEGEEFRTGSIGLQRSREYLEPEAGLESVNAFALFAEYSFVSTVFDPCTSAASLTGPCTLFRLDAVFAFDLEGNELARSTASAGAQTALAFKARPPVSSAALGIAAATQIAAAAAGPRQSSFPFRYLDVGPSVCLEGPTREWTLQRPKGDPFDFGPIYGVSIANDVPLLGGDDSALSQGTYTFRAPGGRDLGGFSESVSTLRLGWPNYRDAFPEIRRDRPLRLDWSGDTGDQQFVSITGSSYDEDFRFSIFSCVVEAGKGSFTLQPGMLREMVATAAPEDGGSGILAVSLGSGRVKSVAGIDYVGVGVSELVTVHSPYTGEGYEPPGLRFVVKVPPEYPPEARQAGIEGEVRATLIVGDGGVPGALVVRGEEILAQAVREVIPQWRIEGAGLVPIVDVVVTFSLTEGVTCELRELAQ